MKSGLLDCREIRDGPRFLAPYSGILLLSPIFVFFKLHTVIKARQIKRSTAERGANDLSSFMLFFSLVVKSPEKTNPQLLLSEQRNILIIGVVSSRYYA